MSNAIPKQKIMWIPFLITAIGALLLTIMIFLPYASANDEYREWLLRDPEAGYIQEIGMKNKDAVDISLFEFSKIYMETIRQDLQKEISVACVVMIIAFAGFSVMTFLLAIFRKPIGVIISDLLTMIVFRILHFDFEDRGVIPSSTYDWGIADILASIIGGIVIGAAIWLLVMKISCKKRRKSK